MVAGAVVLVILAAIDAAYSGDWSRIGVISKDVELGLRPLLGLLGLFHIFCGGITAIAASKKGYNPVPPTLKARHTFASEPGLSNSAAAQTLWTLWIMLNICLLTRVLHWQCQWMASEVVAAVVRAGSGSGLPGNGGSAVERPGRFHKCVIA